MQEKRTPVFQNEDGSWGHVTQTVNPLICTIEYSYNTGFPSKKEAEESYQKSQDAYSNQIQQLKKSRKIPFTFSEYLDYWFREVYSPYSTSKSTLFKYRWVLYQIILPHLQNDVLLDCVSEEFLNKLLDSCQGYCQSISCRSSSVSAGSGGGSSSSGAVSAVRDSASSPVKIRK